MTHVVMITLRRHHYVSLQKDTGRRNDISACGYSSSNSRYIHQHTLFIITRLIVNVIVFLLKDLSRRCNVVGHDDIARRQKESG